MDPTRCAERTKKLRIEPVDASLLRFFASLEDISHDGAGVEVIHSLAIEGTISLPDLVIRSIEPRAHYQPFRECGKSLDPVRGLVGVRIGPGFRAHVRGTLGRTQGCTHFLSLVLDLAASHTLSLFLRMRARVPFEGRNGPDGAWIGTGLAIEPLLENACIAFTSDSPVIAKARHYLGREKNKGTDCG